MNKRLRRHRRIRKKVSGTELRPRVAVFRSNKNMQAQLINDQLGKTLVGLSTIKILDSKKTKIQEAQELGKAFAKMVLELENGKYKKITLDRGGYQYHGRVKAFADSLREAGLEF